MFRNRRFVSLYYSSIGFREILILLWGFILSALTNKKTHKLNHISKLFPEKKILAFSSARGALSACLDFANIGIGDEVILSSFTCLAVPTAIVNLGATPVYVDIDVKTLNNNVDNIVELINPKVKAVILQHTFGNAAEVESLVKLLESKNILVIEDCALSIGTKIESKMLGSFGDASIFSMELSKTITTGWGGILVLKKNLFKNVDLKYSSYYENSLNGVAKDVFQTVISAVCNMPNFYFIGKYLNYSLFKLKIFRYSTNEQEINGSPKHDFISKLAFPFQYLANHQWRRLDVISNKCLIHHTRLQGKLTANGYAVLNRFDQKDGVRPICSRIAFLANDRDLMIDFFVKRGFELGKWFDGPLTPVPKSASFNYVKSTYENSSLISKHVVNLPCHSRLSTRDIKKIERLIDEYGSIYSDQNIVKLDYS